MRSFELSKIKVRRANSGYVAESEVKSECTYCRMAQKISTAM